jgi:hypothetical protein
MEMTMDNAEQVILEGKWVGTIWQEGDGNWACEVNESGNSWDFIDSREDAIEMVLDQSKNYPS